jgi:predicted transcriptional regulator
MIKNMKRDKIEMYIDVLKTIKIEKSPTRIFSISNINYRLFEKEIIPHLIGTGLITKLIADNHADKKMKYFYHLTPRGEKTLVLWKEFGEYLKCDYYDKNSHSPT